MSHIEEKAEEGTFMLELLSKLHSLFELRLSVLGAEETVKKSRLKLQLFTHFGTECQEKMAGRKTLLVFSIGFQQNYSQVYIGVT